VIGLLRAAPASLAGQILRGGGVRQWLWLGDNVPSPIGSVECSLSLKRGPQRGPLCYQLKFAEDAAGLTIMHERLSAGDDPERAGNAYFERTVSRTEFGYGSAARSGPEDERGSMPRSESVLSRFKNPLDETPITEVGKHFEEIGIYREFHTGPNSQTRYGIGTNVPNDYLIDGGENLALVLNQLNVFGVHDRIRHYVARFCERFDDVKVDIGSGLARTVLREVGLVEPLSAMRMSDGTLKFLCLLVTLFHPKPPPLICIEEPETGLHPEALQLVAEVLIEASESVQLIVTTHSDALIDWLSDRPETVLVCERDFDNGTQCKRLDREQLSEWLADYSLGKLWRKGEIGGGRW
jgi:predicted ATPase